MNANEREHWNTRYRDKPESWTDPDELLQASYDRYLSSLPPGLALDVAGGAGRNALYLLQKGWRVDLLDISEVGLQLAREKASASGVLGGLRTEHVDLNTVDEFGDSRYDLITVFFFLRRELFPALEKALKPGGLLICRTYTIGQNEFASGPRDPRYLLNPGELQAAFSSLHILHYEEKTGSKKTAELVARK